MINDNTLGGITKNRKRAQLNAYYQSMIDAGEMTKKEVDKITESVIKKGEVRNIGFKDLWFDPKRAKEMNKLFPNTYSTLRSGLASLNNAIKYVWLVADWGVGQIQLQMLPFNIKIGGPRAWAKGWVKSVGSMFNPEVFRKYVGDNKESARESVQYGMKYGRMEEMLSGAEHGELLPRLAEAIKIGNVKPFKPIAGLFEAFSRQFQTMMDVAKHELWKANRNKTKPEDLYKLAQTIEAITGSAKMEGIGLGKNRIFAERAAFIAPSYYRSFFNCIGAAITEKGTTGKMMRQTLNSYIIGGAALLYAGAMAFGMSKDEIEDMFNPTKPSFGLWHVKINGRDRYFGLGGIYFSVVRLAAEMAKTSISHPENWKSLSPNKNPIVRWYRGHAGPVAGLVWDQFTGKDYLGEDIDITSMKKTVLPITAKEFLRPPGEPRATVLEIATQFLGGRTYGVSANRQFNADRNELAQKKYGKSFNKLRITQQATIVKYMMKQPQYAIKTPATKKEREMALQAEIQRMNDLKDKIKPEYMEELTKRGLNLQGYQPIISIGKGIKMGMTKEEREKYLEYVAQNYNKSIGYLLPRISKYPIIRQQNMLNKYFEMAKKSAKKRLIKEFR